MHRATFFALLVVELVDWVGRLAPIAGWAIVV